MLQTWPCSVRKFASNVICPVLRQTCFNTNASQNHVTAFQHNPLREMGNDKALLEMVGEEKKSEKMGGDHAWILLLRHMFSRDGECLFIIWLYSA